MIILTAELFKNCTKTSASSYKLLETLAYNYHISQIILKIAQIVFFYKQNKHPIHTNAYRPTCLWHMLGKIYENYTIGTKNLFHTKQ